MAKFPIKMRVKQGGDIHPAGTELEFKASQIPALVKAGVIDADVRSDDGDPDFGLKQTVADLIKAGQDIKSMNMADIGKLLGANARGVKRKDIDAVLTELEHENASEFDLKAHLVAALEKHPDLPDMEFSKGRELLGDLPEDVTNEQIIKTIQSLMSGE